MSTDDLLGPLSLVLGHLPLFAGVAALLWAAARRSRTDRPTAALLATAAGFLLLEFAVRNRYALPEPAADRLDGLAGPVGGVGFAEVKFLTVAAACGLAAVVRSAPPADPARKGAEG